MLLNFDKKNGLDFQNVFKISCIFELPEEKLYKIQELIDLLKFIEQTLKIRKLDKQNWLKLELLYLQEGDQKA